MKVAPRFPHGIEVHRLPQATYRIENANLGVLEVFLVPIGPDESGMRYEATFN